jgi:hypothetical protein
MPIRIRRCLLAVVSLGLAAGTPPTGITAQIFPREEEIRIPIHSEVTLAGSLMLPDGEGPFPAAVLLSTSSAEDRDATSSGFAPLREMAVSLAENGIASIRWDDRGMGRSTGKHTYQYTVQDFVGDAVAAVAFLRNRQEIVPSNEAAPMISEGMAEAQNTDWSIRVFPGAGHHITRPWGTFAPGFLESAVAWIQSHTLM